MRRSSPLRPNRNPMPLLSLPPTAADRASSLCLWFFLPLHQLSQQKAWRFQKRLDRWSTADLHCLRYASPRALISANHSSGNLRQERTWAESLIKSTSRAKPPYLRQLQASSRTAALGLLWGVSLEFGVVGRNFCDVYFWTRFGVQFCSIDFLNLVLYSW